MDVQVLEECGHEWAALGMSLSFKDRATPIFPTWNNGETYGVISNYWWSSDKYKKISKTMEANAGRGKGHDKFLRQITVYLMIEAPRYWWSEFDTYKVGTVAQSESTMHSLSKRYMTLGDCEYTVHTKPILEKQIELFNQVVDEGSIEELKQCIPESYLQRRLVTLNYATLSCIINQRRGHRLSEWEVFINSIYDQVQYPELLPKHDHV